MFIFFDPIDRTRSSDREEKKVYLRVYLVGLNSGLVDIFKCMLQQGMLLPWMSFRGITINDQRIVIMGC